MENLEGGKFWGWSKKPIGDCGPQGQLFVDIYQVAWITVDSMTDYHYEPC